MSNKHYYLIMDAHVHVYDCFNIDCVFDAAYKNISNKANELGVQNNFSAMLLLTESAGYDYYNSIINSDRTQCSPHLMLSGWKIIPTSHDGSGSSLIVIQNIYEQRLLLIAGRQIITVEGIEVLGVFCTSSIQDGKPIHETLSRLFEMGALVVLPWGVGKWLGKRGNIIYNLITSIEECNKKSFFIGDIPGRPSAWLRPKHFKLAESCGIRVLSGTDPLPLLGEEKGVGKYGSYVTIDTDINFDTSNLKNIIQEKCLESFGNQDNIFKMIINQILMRFKKLK